MTENKTARGVRSANGTPVKKTPAKPASARKAKSSAEKQMKAKLQESDLEDELEGPEEEEEEEEDDDDESANDKSNGGASMSFPNMNIPFKLEVRSAPKGPAKKSKKRKHDDENNDHVVYPEPEDFSDFVVHPANTWEKLTKYKNFIVGSEKFAVGDYVFVNHSNKLNGSVLLDPTKYWIGRVLDVRASDASHVYVRLFWMYWPHELPGGRQYYHGKKELVASNHMDIIDAMTVSARANVVHWLEADEDEKLPDLFWRQRYDSYTGELWPIRKHCKCRKYYNPDETMIWCNKCHQWSHDTCIMDDILQRHKAEIQPFVPSKKPAGKKASKEPDYSAPNFPVKININEDGSVAAASIVLEDGTTKQVPIFCLLCNKEIEDIKDDD